MIAIASSIFSKEEANWHSSPKDTAGGPSSVGFVLAFAEPSDFSLFLFLELPQLQTHAADHRLAPKFLETIGSRVDVDCRRLRAGSIVADCVMTLKVSCLGSFRKHLRDSRQFLVRRTGRIAG